MLLFKTSSIKVSGCLGKTVFVLILALGSGTLGWFMGKLWLQQALSQQREESIPSIETLTPRSSPFSEEEIKLKSTLRDRQRTMGIDRAYFHNLVDQMVAIETLEEKKQSPTSNPNSDIHRDRLALKVLDGLAALSPEAIARLGSYDENQRNRAKRSVNQLNLSSRALFDLADASLLSKFPSLENQPLDSTPAEQVRDAATFDILKSLRNGNQYERLAFADGEQSLQREGRLTPGQGQAIVIQLTAEQFLTIALDADKAIQMSIYTPTGTTSMLENSRNRHWSGELSETGFYEIILTSRAPTTLPYKLTIEMKK